MRALLHRTIKTRSFPLRFDGNYPETVYSFCSKSEIYKALWFKGGIMKKISKKAFDPIDKEERDLMESIEHDEWRPVKNIKQEKEKAMAAARNCEKG